MPSQCRSTLIPPRTLGGQSSISQHSFVAASRPRLATQQLLFYGLFFFLVVSNLYPLPIVAACPAMLCGYILLLFFTPVSYSRWTTPLGYFGTITLLFITASLSYFVNLTSEF